MKGFLIALLLVSTGSNGQNKSIAVPDAVKAAFSARFPGAINVTWGKESKTEYEAEFNLGDVAAAANFKADGSWVVTETTVTAAALPIEVSNALKSKYANATIIKAEKVELAAGKLYYEFMLANEGKKKEVKINGDGVFQ